MNPILVKGLWLGGAALVGYIAGKFSGKSDADAKDDNLPEEIAAKTVVQATVVEPQPTAADTPAALPHNVPTSAVENPSATDTPIAYPPTSEDDKSAACEYPTSYAGAPSDMIKTIKINGTPRSGRPNEFDTYYDDKRGWRVGGASDGSASLQKHVSDKTRALNLMKQWQEKVTAEVSRVLKNTAEGQQFPKISAAKNTHGATAVTLSLVFRLSNVERDIVIDGKGRKFNAYRDLDLDNLEKAVLDALKNAKLVADDKHFTNIRKRKERADGTPEGVDVDCISTYTMEILEVQHVDGSYFLPGRTGGMQYIRAKNTVTGVEGQFVDYSPVREGQQHEPFSETNGYEWREGTEVDGCMIAKISIHGRILVRLQKWAW